MFFALLLLEVLLLEMLAVIGDLEFLLERVCQSLHQPLEAGLLFRCLVWDLITLNIEATSNTDDDVILVVVVLASRGDGLWVSADLDGSIRRDDVVKGQTKILLAGIDPIEERRVDTGIVDCVSVANYEASV